MNLIKKYFSVWWISTSATILVILIYTIGLAQRNQFINEEFPLLLIVLIFSIVVSFLVQLWKHNWFESIIQMVILFASIFFLLMIALGEPDFYADNLTIPDNVNFEKPIYLINKAPYDSLNALQPTQEIKFILVNDSQPGIYEFYLWFTPQENGYVFLRVFEYTQNDPLSEPRLSKRSTIRVKKGEKKLYKQDFTIYEGEWGQPYAARIELWFRSFSNNSETMILEKNYIVEGWQR